MQQDSFEIAPFPGLDRFTAAARSRRRLRVCIATEEIFGPVRNGGIASTYYHLARTLAADGHGVTVLYLKGRRCENETIEHWIDFYARLGVTFVPLEEEATPLEGTALNWQGRYWAFYRWLKDQPSFDVVHSSEWRGGACYALQAKRQGLAFRDTLFLVKSSSPWIWNRHYTMRTVESLGQLVCMFAERQSVELADLVIGGSAHLLRFMQHKGYRLPAGRTFVQPNIIDLQELGAADGRPRYAHGDRVASRDLVFFGRLEGRKGLEIFCDALDRLLQRGLRPDSVTFLGKQGRNLASHPHLATPKYIEQKAAAWPFPVSVIESYDQDRAIGFLCEKPRIAVMPSIIENSTMTVYECLVHRIPFLATRVGGTPELIAEEHHADTLVAPHPEPLADALERILAEGGTVARGAFDYARNLETWRGFHAWLAEALSKRSAAAVLAEIAAAGGAAETSEPEPKSAPLPAPLPTPLPARPRVSLCLYHHRRPAYLEALVDSLITQEQAPDEVIVVTDGPLSPDQAGHLRALARRLEETEETPAETPEEAAANGAAGDEAGAEMGAEAKTPTRWRFLETPHRCLGAAWNRAAQEATGELLVFLHAERHLARPALVRTLATAAAHSPAAAFSWPVDRFDSQAPRPDAAAPPAARVLPVGGDLASGFYAAGVYAAGCFAVRREAFAARGGFAEAYRLAGVEEELLARLQLAGDTLEVVPEPLSWERQARPLVALNRPSGDYLQIRPFLEGAPHYLEGVLLLARHHEGGLGKLQADLDGARKTNGKLRAEIEQLRKALAEVAVTVRKTGVAPPGAGPGAGPRAGAAGGPGARPAAGAQGAAQGASQGASRQANGAGTAEGPRGKRRKGSLRKRLPASLAKALRAFGPRAR